MRRPDRAASGDFACRTAAGSLRHARDGVPQANRTAPSPVIEDDKIYSRGGRCNRKFENLTATARRWSSSA
ncbi:MAG: hypothetical protein ACLUHG_05305 [Sutterella wadsworthensis]